MLITKQDCRSCEIVKKRVDVVKYNIELIDHESADAMAELCYLGLYGSPLSLPILIDGKTYIAGDINKIVSHIKDADIAKWPMHSPCKREIESSNLSVGLTLEEAH